MYFEISNSLIDCCLSFTFTYVQYVVCQKGSFTCPEQVNRYKCHHAWEVKVTYRQEWWPILWIHILHLTHSTCTHTAVNTHTHTHTHCERTPGAVGSHLCCSIRGAVGGSVPCAVERALYIYSPPPTIPARPRLKLTTFRLWVRLSTIRPRLPHMFYSYQITQLYSVCLGHLYMKKS